MIYVVNVEVETTLHRRIGEGGRLAWRVRAGREECPVGGVSKYREISSLPTRFVWGVGGRLTICSRIWDPRSGSQKARRGAADFRTKDS